MIARHYGWLLLGLILVSAAVSLAFSAFLPETVPLHWGISGEADRFGSRWELLLGMPGLVAGIAGALIAIPWLGPMRRNLELFRETYARVALTLVAGLIAVQFIILLKAAGQALSIGNALCIALGVMFAALGNWMGKLRRNFYMGIRTPWTIANDEVWERTHRLGGKLFAVHGLLCVIAGALTPPLTCFVVMIGGIAVAALWSAIYSLVIYRKLGQVDDLTPNGHADSR